MFKKNKVLLAITVLSGMGGGLAQATTSEYFLSPNGSGTGWDSGSSGDWNKWKSAVEDDFGYDYTKFDTKRSNINNVTGSSIASSDNNYDMGSSVAFDKSGSGSGTTEAIPVSYTLNTWQSGSTVIFNDVPTGKGTAAADAFDDNVLSIGKFNGYPAGHPQTGTQWDHDTFNVTFNNTNDVGVYAFGFRIVNNRNNYDNGNDLGEYFEAFTGTGSERRSLGRSDGSTNTRYGNTYNPADNLSVTGVSTVAHHDGNGDAVPASGVQGLPGTGDDFNENDIDWYFVGVVSDTPISEIWLSEDASSNDIGIQNFYFGTAAIAPVPVPAGVWLFGSGLLSLIGWHRRAEKMTASPA